MEEGDNYKPIATEVFNYQRIGGGVHTVEVSEYSNPTVLTIIALNSKPATWPHQYLNKPNMTLDQFKQKYITEKNLYLNGNFTEITSAGGRRKSRRARRRGRRSSRTRRRRV